MHERHLPIRLASEVLAKGRNRMTPVSLCSVQGARLSVSMQSTAISSCFPVDIWSDEAAVSDKQVAASCEERCSGIHAEGIKRKHFIS